MNINVKFKTQQDYQSVLQISKYVGMTPKQFVRTAVLKQTHELILEVNKRIKEAQDKQVAEAQAAKQQENTNVGELSTVQPEATEAPQLDGEGVNSQA